MTALRKFTRFDCLLEYVPRKRLLFITYLRGARLIHRCCIRGLTKKIAAQFISSFGEPQAYDIFKISMPII